MTLLVCNQEDSFLGPRAFDLVVLDDKLLFQHLNSIQLLRSLCLGKHDFSKVAFAEHCKEVEVVETYTTTASSRVRWRRGFPIFSDWLRDSSRWP